jgi:hypothetical protein
VAIHLYCVLPLASELPSAALRGLSGQPVRRVEAGRVAAWVSDVAEKPIAADLESVRAHDAVTDAATATGVTPLPARFGQDFASDAEVVNELLTGEADLLKALGALAGLVEMRLVFRIPFGGTVVGDAASVAAATGSMVDANAVGVRLGESPVRGKGTAYLERLQRTQQVEQFVRLASASVADRVRSSAGLADAIHGEVITRVTADERPTTGALVAVAHLVGRDAVDAYRVAAEASSAVAGVGRVVVSGPGAPYSFAVRTKSE